MREDYKRKMAKLWGLILIAVLYGGLLFWLRTLTGYPHTDGVIGVILGLYVCSHPASNAVDLLFFQQYPLKQLTTGWSGMACESPPIFLDTNLGLNRV
jgi:hypothetical protein